MQLRNSINQLGNIKINSQSLYETAFIIYFVIAYLQTSTFTLLFDNHTLHRLSFIALALVLFKIFFFDRQNMKSLIVNMLLITFLLITWRTSDDYNLLSMGIFILGARNVDFRRVVFLYFYIGIVILAVVVFSSSIGLIQNLVYHRGNSLRQSFGIIYPTDFAAHILYLILAYCYLYFGKIKWFQYLIFAIIAYLLILFCNARLSAIAILLIIPVIIIGQSARKGRLASQLLASLFWIVPAFLAYLINFITYFYNGKGFEEKINHYLSGRLYFGHLAFEKYGISLFGKHIAEHGWGGREGLRMAKESKMFSYFFVDSSFVRILIMYGFIAIVLLLLVMTFISFRSFVQQDYALASILVIVAISAVLEQRLLDLGYNPFLLALLTSQVYQNKFQEKVGEKFEKLYS